MLVSLGFVRLMRAKKLACVRPLLARGPKLIRIACTSVCPAARTRRAHTQRD